MTNEALEALAEARLQVAINWQARAKQAESERDEARHAKAQAELRWQAAEAECAWLRARLMAPMPATRPGMPLGAPPWRKSAT